MGFDRHRVIEVFAKPVNGPGRVGSGYRVTDAAVLTAGHVVKGLPVRSRLEAAAGSDGAGRCEVRPLGEQAWMNASVLWRDQSADVALIGLAGDGPLLPPGSPMPRWGRVDGMEPIAVSAVGFPWAQERADRVRDSEQLFGFVAPAAMAKAGLCAVTVLTAAPADRAGGSPWAGMSGAALFTGPFLVGVVIVDPPGYGTDRVVAAPIASLTDDAELAGLLGASAKHVVGVGPRLRLAVTAETSVALAPPYRAPTERLGREPARLLLPEYGIVPFVGRDDDLETLAAWCLTGTAPALRVLSGAGGSGKTRLAAETCVRMAGHGWQVGFSDPDAPGGQVQLEFDRPTLLVVDDADLDAPLLAGLVRTLGYWPPGAPPVRLLLLARHTGEWWDTLNRHTNRLAAELADPAVVLHDGELTRAERTEQHTRAVTAFAALVPDDLGPAGHVPPLLADPAFANPLLVHMHALLTVCGAQVPTIGTAVRERVLDAVLDREQDRWAKTFPAGVPTGGARTRQQAVTAATLLVPPTETATAQTMTVISELAPDAVTGARAAMATWLRELYPGGDPPWVAPLRPDLLAEQLLASCPQLSDLVLAGYASITAPEQAEQILTELTRAAARVPVHGALDRLLETHLSDLLIAAIDAPAGRLPDLLDRALARCPRPAEAAALVHRLPEHSTGLAALAGTLTSQAVGHYRQEAAARPDMFTPGFATSLNILSVRLADLGRLEDALAASEEAMTLYRQLAAAQPDTFTPDFAGTLNNLSVRLADLGRLEDALAASEGAVTLYRQLAAAQPDAFSPTLAASLTNQSNRLAGLGRLEDALAPSEEAVGLYRQLAAAQPDAFAPTLATSLNNFSIWLAALPGLGRREDALAAIEEAVTLHQQLAAAQPDAFAADLAMSLTNLSIQLADLGRQEDALAAIEEAVTLRRRLAAARPDAFAPDLATSLNNLSLRLVDLGRQEDALAAIEEAVTLRRRLAAARPDTFAADLAGSLINLTFQLGVLGRREDAMAAIEEAVGLYRQLAAAQPDAFVPTLAMSLTNLSILLAVLGRQEDALAAIEEAVTLRRRLAAAWPDAFAPDLAMSLNNLSRRLADLGRREDAVAAIEEAVGLYRQLAAARPDAFAPTLATSLNDLSILLAVLGRQEDALAASEGAVGLYRQLAAARPDAFAPTLAASLNNQSNRLAVLGRQEDALAAIEEAVTLYRQLAAARPDTFTPGLAKSLMTNGIRLTELGLHHVALAADREALALYRRLHSAHPDTFHSDLANAMRNLVIDLHNLGQDHEADQLRQELTKLTGGT